MDEIEDFFKKQQKREYITAWDKKLKWVLPGKTKDVKSMTVKIIIIIMGKWKYSEYANTSMAVYKSPLAIKVKIY